MPLVKLEDDVTPVIFSNNTQEQTQWESPAIILLRKETGSVPHRQVFQSNMWTPDLEQKKMYKPKTIH